MYRKIVWCYVFVLTLLDISLNTKLSSQGKSHGVTVHDSLIEGITFQEWGKDPGVASGRAVSAGALALWPPALEFGHAALAAAHARTVTLTNTANTTMHLASVAGTTPDFHASFFESKTLPPQANTTFSVVYLGRREGPVAAHLYIHTSLGVHKYPVSAVGVASEWGVWPLVGVRVPLNATLEPLLTLYNPTDQTIQVSEVYSSGAWLRLRLPAGGAAAAGGAWAVPPGDARALVRLRLAPTAADAPALTAYVRIKGNMTGGALVVCVEARAAPPGEYTSPLQLRLRTRGSRDPASVLDVAAGNSAPERVPLGARVWAPRCGPAPGAPPPAPAPAPDHNGANGNGAKSEGVHVSLLRSHLEPHQELTRAAQLTFDYAQLWAGAAGGAGDAAGAWCGGWVTLGRAALPYSVRLLPGTLRPQPAAAHFVTANREEALSARELSVHNEFPVPVHVTRLDYPHDVEQYFEVETKTPLVVGAGASAVVGVVRLRAGVLGPEGEGPGDAGPGGEGPALRTHVLLRTNVTDYTLPLLVYSGRLHVEWEWPNSADGTLRLGALSASSTRRVHARLHNRGVVALCVRALRAELGGATLALDACPSGAAECACVAPGAAAPAVLTVVAPAREGSLRGHVALEARAQDPGAPGASTRAPVLLSAHVGRVRALPLALPDAAPYAHAAAPLVLENTMALTMRLVDVTLPPDDPALSYLPAEETADEVSTGRHSVGTVVYAPEKLCEPHCYTGLDVHSAEGAAWARRGAAPLAGALAADAALQRERHAAFSAHAARHNLTLHAHTTRAVQIPVAGAVGAAWPRLAAAPAAAPLAGVGGASALRVRARNPSRSHALLLQAVVGDAVPLAGAERAQAGDAAPDAFRLVEWRATRGAVRAWDPAAPAPRGALPLLLLAPAAELELKLSFAPQEPRALAATLYLRNNLTILEGVPLAGRGAYPSFELGGRRPGTDAPLLFEVSACGGAAGAGGPGGALLRLVARNTGRVRVRLRDWRVAGEPCQARGFRLTPCAPLSLAPNESRPLTLAFSADWTLARVAATLTLRTELGRAAFPLRAAAPARLLPRCAAQAPRPPWEPALRAAGSLLALAALALVLAAAALDAERELRRARAARPPPAPRQPLDLRALALAPPPAARRPPARRRRPVRPGAPPDAAAERRAFERWRHEVLRRPDDDERSSEDNEPAPDATAAPRADEAPPDCDATEPGDEPPAATDGYEADPETEDRRPASGDDDAASTGSGSASASSSSPTADVDEPDDRDERDRSPPRDRPEPARGDDSPPPPARGAPPAEVRPRPRRDLGDMPRRADRNKGFENGEATSRSRAASAKHHTRKDKVSKRRERPPASPPRSPPRSADCRAPGALRWGASWSSVVAARGGAGAGAGPAGPAPLAPIGSDVRRRADPAPADHSLFYFNGDPTHAPPRDPDFSWRPPPQVDRPTFSPSRDFLDEAGGGSFRSLGSVWGSALEPRPAAAAWLWGGVGAEGSVRPPPGFGAPARPVRPYDPFRSLASIWAPGALDWRSDTPPPAPDDPAPR